MLSTWTPGFLRGSCKVFAVLPRDTPGFYHQLRKAWTVNPLGAHAHVRNGRFMFSRLGLTLGHQLVKCVQFLVESAGWIHGSWLFTCFTTCPRVQATKRCGPGAEYRIRAWLLMSYLVSFSLLFLSDRHYHALSVLAQLLFLEELQTAVYLGSSTRCSWKSRMATLRFLTKCAG